MITGQILDAKIKEKGLSHNSIITNFTKRSDLNTKLAALATKADLKPEQDKLVKLQAFDSNYFCGKSFLVIMVFKICYQNMFINQHPTFNTLEFKKKKKKRKKSLNMLLFAGNQNVYLNPNFFHYMAFPNLTKYCG